jgi:hypothetical protein
MHSKTLPNNFQFSLGPEEESEIISERIKMVLDRLEKYIEYSQDELMERASKHINEHCEGLLFKNFNKQRVKKLYKRLQFGMCDMILRKEIFKEKNLQDVLEFEKFEKTSPFVRVIVDKEFSNILNYAYFDVKPYERILSDSSSFQRDFDEAPLKKNSLLINFKKSEEKKMRMLASFRRSSISQSEKFITRSFRSSFSNTHNAMASTTHNAIANLYSPQKENIQLPTVAQQRASISISDYFRKNQAIAFIRLGAINLVYANRFLHLDQWERESADIQNVIREVKKTKMKLDSKDNIEIVVNRLNVPVTRKRTISLNHKPKIIHFATSDGVGKKDSQKSVIENVTKSESEVYDQDEEEKPSNLIL